MKLKIQKWGKSAAVCLPTTMLKQLGVRAGDSFEVDVSGSVVTFRVTKPRYKLADLHTEMPDGLTTIRGMFCTCFPVSAFPVDSLNLVC